MSQVSELGDKRWVRTHAPTGVGLFILLTCAGVALLSLAAVVLVL